MIYQKSEVLNTFSDTSSTHILLTACPKFPSFLRLSGVYSLQLLQQILHTLSSCLPLARSSQAFYICRSFEAFGFCGQYFTSISSWSLLAQSLQAYRSTRKRKSSASRANTIHTFSTCHFSHEASETSEVLRYFSTRNTQLTSYFFLAYITLVFDVY